MFWCAMRRSVQVWSEGFGNPVPGRVLCAPASWQASERRAGFQECYPAALPDSAAANIRLCLLSEQHAGFLVPTLRLLWLKPGKYHLWTPSWPPLRPKRHIATVSYFTTAVLKCTLCLCLCFGPGCVSAGRGAERGGADRVISQRSLGS